MVARITVAQTPRAEEWVIRADGSEVDRHASRRVAIRSARELARDEGRVPVDVREPHGAVRTLFSG